MTRYLVFAVVLALPPAFGAEKLPVPPDAALESPLALIKEVYGEEHANAKTNQQLQALAKKLFSEGSKTDKPIECFALLRVARDIATEGCDGLTAYQIIDEMDGKYQVDAVTMKASVLYSLSKQARLPADHKSIAEQALALTDLAIARDDFVLSGKLAEMALSEARKVRDTDYVKMVVDRGNEIEELGNAYAEVRAAAEKLEKNPTDPEANLAVGRYRCLFKGDWENGLPMLALGSDAALKDLAVKELGDVAKPEEQAELGDRWWELAEETEGVERGQLRRRAAYWYQQAVPHLRALAKAKVEKRLSDIRTSTQDALKPNWGGPTWFGILDSPQALANWRVVHGKPRFVDGWLRLYDRDVLVLHKLQARDMMIRAKAQFGGAKRAALVLRGGECAFAVESFKGGPCVAIWRRGDKAAVLANVKIPKIPQGIFEMGFSAIGNRLTGYLNNQPVLTAEIDVISEGGAGFWSHYGTPLFSDIEISVLKQ